MGDFTRVTIDFQTSHLVFPTLIGAILLALGAAILITRRQAIAGAGQYWSQTLAAMDKPRFFGTIALTVVYFLLMVPVGDFWPNTGMGFLVCSIPFVALSGLLYLQERTKSAVTVLAVVAVAAPLLVWWVFAHVFFLTLP
ncbi:MULTISPECIES: tripartite tricarboxylate transporter TctB family protein [unclassified Mesorhizobium]|uniref:tripartite tricarboxylate transporter TctB family protein n=1 Tax=Mesorhizobium TaxID=68287 RepID=UPI0003D01261|nr:MULTISPECIES: tripartite tricarboxylate transporter TctB family protein [unclassified Mesorhizobium]ESZ22173.1 tripartite Tricarboxylate transporter (TTT) small transmembrane protein [Mesorhizobium sp. L48C026A00]RWN53104.1 MAG: tripartite tricarboxylate transporter [Mesorhizobium sp.]RWN73751.1 MAG: tripartite tricarboxylate transporter [Mesorhizobium sp.]RWN76895.1 MAG: tripartite tricarboxylate transporter [Mesorhizobium sp.]RWN88070.1 MAG: tripartite tricarboxylate transporter [Mesorhiz